MLCKLPSGHLGYDQFQRVFMSIAMPRAFGLHGYSMEISSRLFHFC